jgi:hypothetical protein
MAQILYPICLFIVLFISCQRTKLPNVQLIDDISCKIAFLLKKFFVYKLVL